MKMELQEQLFKRYPELFKQKDLPMSQTCMCWGIETDDGWYDLIDTMCELLTLYCDRHGLEVQFTQIKSKYGTLTADTTGNEGRVERIIDMVECMSEHTCEKCGEWGNTYDDGWVRTLCPKHKKERELKVDD